MVSEQITQEMTDRLDQIIMKYWDTKKGKERKRLELECYKVLKWSNYNESVIRYLEENGAEELASEMHHFFDVYNKAPHEHEKPMAA